MAIWTTELLPPTEQFDYFHEVICHAFVPLRPVSNVDGAGFSSSVETRPMGALTRARVTSQRQTTLHGPREVSATDRPYYFVNVQVSGTCRAEQGSYTSLIAPGQATILDTTRPFRLDFDSTWSMLSYRVPHDLVPNLSSARSSPFARPFDHTGAGAAAIGLVHSLWSVSEIPTSARYDLTSSFASAISALATTGRGESNDTTVSLPVVLGLLALELGDLSFTAESVSRRLGISLRRLHALFADSDDTFASTLREMRMRRAVDLLADPSLTITEVGRAVGYADPSSFARAFRQVRGEPPTAARESLHGLHGHRARSV